MNRGHEIPGNGRSESARLTIPASGSVEFRHGLLRVPAVTVSLLCLVAENAYSAGDEIPTDLGYLRNTAAPSQPFLSYAYDAGKVTVTRNTGNAQVWSKDASGFATITTASWAIKVRCV